MNRAQFIAEVLRTPWALADFAYDALVRLVASPNLTITPEVVRAQIGAPEKAAEPYFVAADGARIQASAVGGKNGKLIAVIPIEGVITNGSGDCWWGTTTGKLSRQIREAVANSDVKAIVLDVDSPGGSVYGVDELAAEIFAAREQKKIIAQVNPLCASAAYYLASQASEIVIMPSGEVGSIGVRMMWVGYSEYLKQAGIEVQHIFSGKYKVEGNPYEALGEEARAFFQKRCDEYYEPFLKAVARGRGVKSADVRTGFGEGRVVGAVDAKSLGLADRVATLEQTIARLGGDMQSAASMSAERRSEDGDGCECPCDECKAGNCEECSHEGCTCKGCACEEQASSAETVLTTAEAEQQEVLNMSTVATPAAAAASPDVERIMGLTALAETQNRPDKLASWIKGGVTVQQAQTELLNEFKATARPVQPAERPAGSAGRAEHADGRKGPFASFGDQLIAVAQASMPGGRVDDRLFKVQEIAAATGQSAGAPSEGGFLVQTDFSPELMQRAYDTGILASRCSRTEIGPNSDSLEVPYVDETDRATGSRWGGITVYRAAEAAAITASKTKLGKWECRLEDMVGAVYVTERLLRDAPAMTSFVNEAFGNEFGFVLDDEILEGDGAGKCLGILKSKALVTIAKEAGQAAGSVVTENIVKMWAAFWARSRSSQGAAWFYNQELDSQLPLLNVGVGTAGQPVFLPPGGLSGKPYATLYGLPMLPVEQASAPGTVGDIVLADMAEYKLVEKGGIQAAESIHVKFLNLEKCFRFVTSVNGQPKWKSTLKPFKGSASFVVSPFVALAAR